MQETLEELTKHAEKFKAQKEGHKIPLHKKMIRILKENWYNTTKPPSKNKDLISTLTRGQPGGQQFYMLWNLSTEAHQDFNEIIGATAYHLKKISPKSATYLGIFKGLSELIYGLKEDESRDPIKKGMRTISGLTGLSKHLKEVEDPEAKKLGEKAYRLLNKHFPSEEEKAA